MRNLKIVAITIALVFTSILSSMLRMPGKSESIAILARAGVVDVNTIKSSVNYYGPQTVEVFEALSILAQEYEHVSIER